MAASHSCLPIWYRIFCISSRIEVISGLGLCLLFASAAIVICSSSSVDLLSVVL